MDSLSGGISYNIHTMLIYLLQKKVVGAISFKSFTSPSTPLVSEFTFLKCMVYLISSCSLLSMSLLIRYLLPAFLVLSTFCQKFINMIPGKHVKVIFLLHKRLHCIMVYDLLDMPVQNPGTTFPSTSSKLPQLSVPVVN